MSNDGVWSSSVKPPIWKSENPAGCSVSQSASVAAIFIGCASVTATPNSLPTPSWTTETGQPDDDRELRRAAEDARRCGRAAGASRRRRARGTPPVISPARTTCAHAKSRNPWKRMSTMSFASRSAGLRVDLVADRVLHPRVRGQDEVGREPGPDPDEVDRGEVHLRREPVPAEDPEPDERRLEHERAEALDRERCAEDVAHVGARRPTSSCRTGTP